MLHVNLIPQERNIMKPIALTLVGVVLGLVGCGKPRPEDRFVRPEMITDFHRLFGTHCSGCHGADGTLGPGPVLNDRLFQTIVSSKSISDVISQGREGTQMPAFVKSEGGPLTVDQVKILVDGIREHWAGKRIEGKDLPQYEMSEDDPAGLAKADAQAGAKVYASACAGCHGKQGQGGKGGGAIADPSLGNLMSDQLVRRTILVGRPDLGMPNYVDVGTKSSLKRALNDQEIVDLSAFVRQLQQHTSSLKSDDKTSDKSEDNADNKSKDNTENKTSDKTDADTKLQSQDSEN